MMAGLRRFFTSHWVISLLGLAGLAAIVWWFGPLVALGATEPWRPLGTIESRLWVIGGLACLWLIGNSFKSWRTWRRNRAMVQALAPDPADLARDGERDAITRNFERTLAQLAKRRFGKADGRLLVQMPWYLLIGPPGSGKTTALLNSGLEFPLDDAREIRGVGGTRHCDWFFTEEAVLIDTAGRYTTQDLDVERDRGGWDAFLDLLVRHRPQQPANGVLVALSVTDLMDDSERAARLARTLRERLQELQARLGVALPVYLVLTKLDLVGGFAEFFEELDVTARRQVWGTTFPEADTSTALRSLPDDWERLVERLGEHRLDRLEDERDPTRAARILAFPAQLALLGPSVMRFTAELFRDFGDTIWWRGLYLTSGTQEGTPVDRLVGRLAGGFGLATRPVPAAMVRSIPYFLTDLLRELIFPEAGLVAGNSSLARRATLVQRLSWTAAGLATLVVAGLWGWSYMANAARSVEIATALDAVSRTTPALHTDEILAGEDDLRAVLPALDALRDLPTGVATADASTAWRFDFGLSQQARSARYTRSAYETGLYRLMLPRLLADLERDLRGNINDPDYVFEGLRTYLLVGERARFVAAGADQRELDSLLIRAWFEAGWESRFTSDERTRLLVHLDALLAMPVEVDHQEVSTDGTLRFTSKTPLDGTLIARAQATLQALPLERRAYQMVQDDPELAYLEPLRFADLVPVGSQLFTRRSGRPLDVGIPAMFTYAAFHGLGLDYGVLAAIDAAVADVADDAWVRGDPGPLPEAQRPRLVEATRQLYYQDYIRVWDTQLADIRLKPPTGLESGVDTLLVLSQPGSSPLQQWIDAVLEQVSLTEAPIDPEAEAETAGGGGGAKVAAKLAAKAAGKLGAAGKGALRVAKLAKKNRAKLGRVAGGATAPAVAGQPVADHFKDLAALVDSSSGGTPPLQLALASLGGAYRQLNDVAAAARAGQPVPPGSAATQLDKLATGLPSPLGEMLGGVASATATLGAGTARGQLDARWQADVLPFCRQALGGRFPFAGSSSVDVNLDDFSRLFAPGGLIDSFFEANLRPWVDTAQRPWRWRDADGQSLGISNGALATFERAARIRDSLFALGSSPAANFQLTPLELDPRAEQVRLDVDGQVVEYRHGPQMPSQLRWPGPAGTTVVRLSVAPIGAAPVTLAREGPWSWFRLLQTGRLTSGSVADRFAVEFDVQGYRASFTLAAGSVANPFDQSLFRGFQCVGAL